MDGNEQLSKQVYLNNFGNDRVYGGLDTYKGRTVARFFEGLNDLLDFYPQDSTGELQLQVRLVRGGWFELFWQDVVNISIKVKLDPGGTVGAAWNTDLVKLYFAADQGRETVMTCLAGAAIKKASCIKSCYAAQEQLVL